MKYLCLVYLSEEHWNSCADDQCGAYAQELIDGGHLIAGDPLHGVHTATSVRIRNGQLSVTDGPFAETKEMLAGYYMVDAKDLNEAIRLASGIPPAKFGTIEVRPVRMLDIAGGTPSVEV
jgi:hypothetical protein